MNESIDQVNQQGALRLDVFESMGLFGMFKTAINEFIHLFVINSS